MKRRDFIKTTAVALASGILIRAQAQEGGGSLKMRRNLADLEPNDPFFKDYAKAIKALHGANNSQSNPSPLSWRGQSLIHVNFCPHGQPDFSPGIAFT